MSRATTTQATTDLFAEIRQGEAMQALQLDLGRIFQGGPLLRVTSGRPC